MPAQHHSPSLVRGLGLFATIAIVVGDVIGTGVFLKARVMTCDVGTPGLALAAWTVAGLLSLAGALTYGELAAMMPEAGGEYVYLRNGYGRLWGFLFGWSRFFIGSTGGNAALAAGLAIFLNVVLGGALSGHQTVLYLFDTAWPLGAVQGVAIAAIVVATAINCASVSMGGAVASVFTILKIGLVLGVGVAILALGAGDWSHFATSGAGGTCDGVTDAARGGMAGFGAAMLAALWAYNGWNEVTYVGGEVRDPQRNLPIALIAGIGIIGALYLFVNTAYYYVLTPMEIANMSATSSERIALT